MKSTLTCCAVWGVLWTNGAYRYLVRENCVPALFATRRGARNYIRAKYGYIKTRADLRGWSLPVAVRVTVTLSRMQEFPK